MVRDLDKQQITGVVTAAGRVRVKQSDGSRRYLHLARATDPLRRPIPALWWDLEDMWFIGVLVVSCASTDRTEPGVAGGGRALPW